MVDRGGLLGNLRKLLRSLSLAATVQVELSEIAFQTLGLVGPVEQPVVRRELHWLLGGRPRPLVAFSTCRQDPQN